MHLQGVMSIVCSDAAFAKLASVTLHAKFTLFMAGKPILMGGG